MNEYNHHNSILKDNKELIFMNHGYFPIHKNCSNLLLDSSGSLYCHILDHIQKTEDKNIIDIGCGRGGGVSLIKQFYNFSQVYACDNNLKNIEFCRNNFKDIVFEHDNAEKLDKFKEKSLFDYVLNIESSHCYKNKNLFFSSVKQILKNGGVFFYADIFPKENITFIDDIIKKYFCVNQKENISKNVAESCEYMIDKLSMYKEPEIKYVRDIFAATEKFYKSGESVFYYYVLSQ